MNHPEFPYALIHATGCGKPAYLIKQRPKPGSMARSDEAAMLDGSPVKPRSAFICGSCGQLMKQISSADVVERGDDER